jgi:hypothetical protein
MRVIQHLSHIPARPHLSAWSHNTTSHLDFSSINVQGDRVGPCLHAGGRGFESHRLHSGKPQVRRSICRTRRCISPPSRVHRARGLARMRFGRSGRGRRRCRSPLPRRRAGRSAPPSGSSARGVPALSWSLRFARPGSHPCGAGRGGAPGRASRPRFALSSRRLNRSQCGVCAA